MQKNNKYRYVPFYVSLGVVLGILIGSFYANQYSQKFLSIIDGSGNKLSDLLYIIDDQYVDVVKSFVFLPFLGLLCRIWRFPG